MLPERGGVKAEGLYALACSGNGPVNDQARAADQDGGIVGVRKQCSRCEGEEKVVFAGRPDDDGVDLAVFGHDPDDLHTPGRGLHIVTQLAEDGALGWRLRGNNRLIHDPCGGCGVFAANRNVDGLCG